MVFGPGLVALFARLWCEKDVSRSCMMFFVMQRVGFLFDAFMVSFRFLLNLMCSKRTELLAFDNQFCQKNLLKQLLACPFAYESPPAIYHPSPESMGQNSSICNLLASCSFMDHRPIIRPTITNSQPDSKQAKQNLCDRIKHLQTKTWIRKWPLEKWCFEKTTFYTHVTFPFCWGVLPSPNPSQTCREKKLRRNSCFCQGDIILFLEAGIQVWGPLF